MGACHGASSQALHIIGIYNFDLQIGDKNLRHLVHVIKNLHKGVILRIDFIQVHRLSNCPETQNFAWSS